MKSTLYLCILTALFAFGLTGCDNNQSSALSKESPAAPASGAAANSEKPLAVKAEAAADKAREATREAADNAADKAEELADKAKSAAGDLADKAAAAAAEAKESVGEAVDNAKEAAGEAVDKAKEAAGEAADKVEAMAKEAAGKVEAAVKGEEPALTEKELLHRRFLLKSANGREYSLHDRRPELQFNEGLNISGGFCNRFSGQATLKDHVLTVGPMATTRMHCPEEDLNKLELLFAQAMGKGMALSFNGEILTMKGEGLELVYELKELVR